MSGFRRRAFVPLQRQWLRKHHPDPLNPSTKGWRSAVKEGELPDDVWRREVARGLELGLPAASSIEDRDIPTFSRGELPHFAGINTFMKAPYLEDVRQVGAFDATVMGVPYDGGTTYRSGTRFGPQGIRRISALYSPYNYELGVDLREQMTLCDAGEPAPRATCQAGSPRVRSQHRRLPFPRPPSL
jgi:agmatinase